MFAIDASDLARTVMTAPPLQLHALAQAISSDMTGRLSDDLKHFALTVAQERQRHQERHRPPLRLPKGREPRSPDREASLRRRRAAARCAPIPAAIACQFTQGEVAALGVIAREARKTGSCRLPIDAIAALSGTSRSVVKRALREAKRLGLIAVTERRRPGRKSLSNIVRIISREWRAWLGHIHKDRGSKSTPHGSQIVISGESSGRTAAKGLAKEGGRKAPPASRGVTPPSEPHPRNKRAMENRSQ